MRIAVAIALLFLAAAPVVAGEPETITPPGICFVLHEAEPGTVMMLRLPCPRSSESPLIQVLRDLATLHPAGAEAAAEIADDLHDFSDATINRLTCRAVRYVRSITKFQRDPEPDRDRSGKEIVLWLQDLTGPGRPWKARLYAPLFVEGGVFGQPEEAKRWHDALKAVWPAVSEQTCPDMEPPSSP